MAKRKGVFANGRICPSCTSRCLGGCACGWLDRNTRERLESTATAVQAPLASARNSTIEMPTASDMSSSENKGQIGEHGKPQIPIPLTIQDRQDHSVEYHSKISNKASSSRGEEEPTSQTTNQARRLKVPIQYTKLLQDLRDRQTDEKTPGKLVSFEARQNGSIHHDGDNQGDNVGLQAPLPPIYRTTWGTPLLSPVWSVVSLAECKQERSEGTFVVGVLLAVKHHSSSQSKDITLRSTSKVSPMDIATDVVKFSRLFKFADYNTPGRCFLMIAETALMAERLLMCTSTSSRDRACVGGFFAILEPFPVTKHYNSMGIVRSPYALLPLELPSPLKDMPLTTPRAGMQRYFILKNWPLELKEARVVEASCKGFLCDRQTNLVKGDQRCGCLYLEQTTRRQVLCMDIHFSCTNPDGKDIEYHVNRFRSWRTTTIMIRKSAFSVDAVVSWREKRKELQSAVAKIGTIVNENGGWTLVGCYDRRGEEKHTSPAGMETHMLVYLMYVFPSERRALELARIHQFDPTKC